MRSSKQSYAHGHRAKSKHQDNSKEFEKYYTKVYGSRWPTLREALLKPTLHAAMANTFLPASAATDSCTSAGMQPLLSAPAPPAFRLPHRTSTYPPPPLHPTPPLRTWYWLDAASLLPVLLLEPARGHAVLDMCAAPGGKSVLIAQRMWGNAAAPPPPPATRLLQQDTAVAAEAQQEVAANGDMKAVERGGTVAPVDTVCQTGAAGRDPLASIKPEPAEGIPQAGGVLEEGALEAGISKVGISEVGAANGPSSSGAPTELVITAGATAVSTSQIPLEEGAQPSGESPAKEAGVTESQEARIHTGQGGATSPQSHPLPPSPPQLVPPAGPAPVLPLPAGPGKLVCNELDRSRLQRLSRVLEEYLPTAVRANVEVLSHPGHTYWFRAPAGRYDRVLVDAPCSSDRHVLQQAAGAGRGVVGAVDWSLAGCKRIADEQLQLCLAGMRALRPGGRLVYSTCSLSPSQNDEVVGRLMERLGPEVVVRRDAVQMLMGLGGRGGREEGEGGQETGVEGGMPEGGTGGDEAGREVVRVLGVEATRHGAIVLPDVAGWGPIYMAVLDKVGVEGGLGGSGRLLGGDQDDEEQEEESVGGGAECDEGGEA